MLPISYRPAESAPIPNARLALDPRLQLTEAESWLRRTAPIAAGRRSPMRR